MLSWPIRARDSIGWLVVLFSPGSILNAIHEVCYQSATKELVTVCLSLHQRRSSADPRRAIGQIYNLSSKLLNLSPKIELICSFRRITRYITSVLQYKHFRKIIESLSTDILGKKYTYIFTKIQYASVFYSRVNYWGESCEKLLTDGFQGEAWFA